LGSKTRVRLEQRFDAGATIADLLDDASPSLSGAAGYRGTADVAAPASPSSLPVSMRL
jgi:hypothetical protein